MCPYVRLPQRTLTWNRSFFPKREEFRSETWVDGTIWSVPSPRTGSNGSKLLFTVEQGEALGGKPDTVRQTPRPVSPYRQEPQGSRLGSPPLTFEVGVSDSVPSTAERMNVR